MHFKTAAHSLVCSSLWCHNLILTASLRARAATTNTDITLILDAKYLLRKLFDLRNELVARSPPLLHLRWFHRAAVGPYELALARCQEIHRAEWASSVKA